MKAMKAMKAMKKKTVSKVQGQVQQGAGAPWLQGKDSWWLDGEGPYEEQARPGGEQEEERLRQDQPLDCCRQEGTCCIEDQGLRSHQEGHTPLRQGKGVLQGLKRALRTCIGADLRQMTDAGACVRHQLRLWGFLQPLSAGAPNSEHRI